MTKGTNTFRIPLVLPAIIVVVLALTAGTLLGQEQAPPSPQVRVNLINVCTPGEAEQSEIGAALARIPEHPGFGPDFEIARGRTTQKNLTSNWVRMRRDFARDNVFTNAQFLLTFAGNAVDEMLVLHLKANKPGDPLQISLQNQVVAADPAEVLSAHTPPNRIRLERFGKPSLVLARCPEADQRAYEPLFRTATDRFGGYRSALNAHALLTVEIQRLKTADTAAAKGSRK